MSTLFIHHQLVAENPGVPKYLMKNTAVVLVLPSPKIWICHSLEMNTARLCYSESILQNSAGSIQGVPLLLKSAQFLVTI